MLGLDLFSLFIFCITFTGLCLN